MTLYRIGSNSPIVDRLIDAAERGKQVAVLVELKARFDERSNIGWATRLEEAGVHVVYGLVNLKTHCKLCLVVRKEGERIQRYVAHRHRQLQPDDRADLHGPRPVHRQRGDRRRRVGAVQLPDRLFAPGPTTVRCWSRRSRCASGSRRWSSAKSRTPGPACRRRSCIKTNSISDPDVIRLLYRASQAGVRIDAIVRGICCLRPGVPASAS